MPTTFYLLYATCSMSKFVHFVSNESLLIWFVRLMFGPISMWMLYELGLLSI